MTALVALSMAGCGSFSTPGPTAGAMDDVIAALVLRGATVHRLISGDAGCPGSGLHNNAVHMEVSLGTQSSTHEIYLFRWRRAGDFASASMAFDECAAEYRSLNPARTVDHLEAEPWRAYGPAWPDELRATLTEALRAAGGSP